MIIDPAGHFGSQEDLAKMRLLSLLCRLKLISPETYTDAVAGHIDPMSQIQYEMDRLGLAQMKMLTQVIAGPAMQLQKATGAELDALMDMMGLSESNDA